MAKIKINKQLRLSDLIQWGLDNDIKNEFYRACDSKRNLSEVYFDTSGIPQFSSTVSKNDVFNVEIDELIMEDTVIPSILEINENKGNTESVQIHENMSIEDIKKKYKEKDYIGKTLHFLKDDTVILIWKDGKIVEWLKFITLNLGANIVNQETVKEAILGHSTFTGVNIWIHTFRTYRRTKVFRNENIVKI